MEKIELEARLIALELKVQFLEMQINSSQISPAPTWVTQPLCYGTIPTAE